MNANHFIIQTFKFKVAIFVIFVESKVFFFFQNQILLCNSLLELNQLLYN